MMHITGTTGKSVEGFIQTRSLNTPSAKQQNQAPLSTLRSCSQTTCKSKVKFIFQKMCNGFETLYRSVFTLCSIPLSFFSKLILYFAPQRHFKDKNIFSNSDNAYKDLAKIEFFKSITPSKKLTEKEIRFLKEMNHLLRVLHKEIYDHDLDKGFFIIGMKCTSQDEKIWDTFIYAKSKPAKMENDSTVLPRKEILGKFLKFYRDNPNCQIEFKYNGYVPSRFTYIREIHRHKQYKFSQTLTSGGSSGGGAIHTCLSSAQKQFEKKSSLLEKGFFYNFISVMSEKPSHLKLALRLRKRPPARIGDI